MLARLDRVRYLGGGGTQIVFLALFFGVSLSCYLLVLKIRGPAGESLKTWIEADRAFPFTPWWTWIYLIPYAVGPLLVGILRRDAFIWYIHRATVVVVISLVIFVAVPTQTIRPLAEDCPDREENAAKLDDGLTSRLYRQMVAIDDPPANAAPSLHVSLSCLLALVLAFDGPRWWWAFLIAAVLICLSTLYTAQHHLIDVLTGAGLALVVAVTNFRAFGKPSA